MRKRTATITVNGKERQINLFTKEELEQHRMLLDLHRSAFDEATHECVCSYRRGKSNIGAVKELSIAAANYKYFIKCDIKEYFYSISQEHLALKLLFIIPSEAKRLIMFSACSSNPGIAVGSPLSPALSSLYLFDFDTKIHDYHDVFYRRFSDDFIILTNLEPHAVLAYVEQKLANLGLSLNLTKTRVGEVSASFDFLGFTISSTDYKITKEKISQILARIKNAPTKTRRQQIIKGWWAYCKTTDWLPLVPQSIALLVRSGKLICAWRFTQELLEYKRAEMKKANRHPKKQTRRSNFAYDTDPFLFPLQATSEVML